MITTTWWTTRCPPSSASTCPTTTPPTWNGSGPFPTKTGGTFSRVNTNDPKAMETILKGIISTITKNTQPKSATITNKSLAPPQVSKSTGATSNPDGSTGMKLDSIIALQEGPNQIEISLVREDSTVKYNFTMNVSAGEIGVFGRELHLLGHAHLDGHRQEDQPARGNLPSRQQCLPAQAHPLAFGTGQRDRGRDVGQQRRGKHSPRAT